MRNLINLFKQSMQEKGNVIKLYNTESNAQRAAEEERERQSNLILNRVVSLLESRWPESSKNIAFFRLIIRQAADSLNLSETEVVEKSISTTNKDEFVRKALEIFSENESQNDQEWIIRIFNDAHLEPTNLQLYLVLNRAYNCKVVLSKHITRDQFNKWPLVVEAGKRGVTLTAEDHISVYLTGLTEETEDYKLLLRLRENYNIVAELHGAKTVADEKGTFIERTTEGIAKFFRTDSIYNYAKSLVKLVDDDEESLNWKSEKIRTALRSFIFAGLKSLSATGYPTVGFNYFTKAMETCREKIPMIAEILNESDVRRVASLIYEEILEGLGYKIIYLKQDEIETWAKTFGIDDWQERMQNRILKTADDMANKIISPSDFSTIFLKILGILAIRDRDEIFQVYYNNLLERDDTEEITQVAMRLSNWLKDFPHLLTQEQKQFLATALYNALNANDPTVFIDSADALLQETERPKTTYFDYLRSIQTPAKVKEI